MSVFRSNSAAVLLAVFAAVIGYLALVFATHILTPKDILQLPLRKSLRMKMLRM